MVLNSHLGISLSQNATQMFSKQVGVYIIAHKFFGLRPFKSKGLSMDYSPFDTVYNVQCNVQYAHNDREKESTTVAEIADDMPKQAFVMQNFSCCSNNSLPAHGTHMNHY